MGMTRARGLVARVAALVAVLVAVLLMSPALAAQNPKDEFVPVTDIMRETLPATPLLFAAYAFVWVALVAYVFVLWRRIERVERELADVTSRLGRSRP